MNKARHWLFFQDSLKATASPWPRRRCQPVVPIATQTHVLLSLDLELIPRVIVRIFTSRNSLDMASFTAPRYTASFSPSSHAPVFHAFLCLHYSLW